MTFFKKKAHSTDKMDSLRLINETTPFAINEAFRTLYTKIVYLPISDKCRKIAITSAVSGEGKTYISINLAITLARNSENKKILLVDLDMRKPRVARILSKYRKGSKPSGLSEYLAGIDSEPNIIDTDIPNFSILFSGKDSSNAIGLLNSGRMDELLDLLAEKYDYVIFDTPPVSLVSDAAVIADKVNGYIITVRSDYSNVNHISNAIDNLTNVGGEIFGLVLTSANPKLATPSSIVYQGANYYYTKKED